MDKFLQTTEQRLLAFFSAALALNTLFFIAREVKQLRFLVISENTHLFYFLYLAIGICVSGTLAFFAKKWAWRDWIAKKIIVFSPTALLLIFALGESGNFHYIFFIALGAYVLAVGFLLISLHHEKTRKEKTEEARTASEGTKNWLALQKKSTLGILTLLTVFHLGFGGYRIAEFAAVDEALWTFGKRISKYWVNIGERKWSSTKVSDKPGVTVSIISGTGLLFVNPKEYKPVKWEGSTVHSPKDIRVMNFALRFPILLFASLSLFVFYIFLERLLGQEKALISTILIGTSPLLLGMARIINPDSLLWIFGSLSIIAHLVFLKHRSLRYLYWAGVFLGLALLTKYVANILFVLFFGFIFLDYLMMKRSQRATLDFVRFLKTALLHYLILTFIALAVFYILYPLMWVKPDRLLDATLLSQAFATTWPLFIGIFAFIFLDQWTLKNRLTQGLMDAFANQRKWVVRILLGIFLGSILFVVLNTLSSMRWYDFTEILASPKSSYAVTGFRGVFFANFYPLLFGIHPLALLAVLALSIRLFWRARKRSRTAFVSTALILFILVYYLGTTVNHVATIFRYQIMLFPTILILAGIALAIGLKALERRFPRLPFNFLAFILFLIVGSSVVRSSPQHLGYASGLLPSRYHINIKDMGTGSFEAAQFLNSLPNADMITIWTDKSGVCTFFDGNCYSSFNFSSLNKKHIDYVVVSSGRQSRTGRMINPERPGVIRFDRYYDRTDGVFNLFIDNRPSDFVKVIPFER